MWTVSPPGRAFRTADVMERRQQARDVIFQSGANFPGAHRACPGAQWIPFSEPYQARPKAQNSPQTLSARAPHRPVSVRHASQARCGSGHHSRTIVAKCFHQCAQQPLISAEPREQDGFVKCRPRIRAVAALDRRGRRRGRRFDCAHKCLRLDGLCKVAVPPSGQAAFAVSFHVVSGHRENRDMSIGGFFLFANRPRRLPSQREVKTPRAA
jgi:hypothetical protein